MIATGLDRLVAGVEKLNGRRYGVLAHAASTTADHRPIVLALLDAGAPEPLALFGPEHGFHGVEQDMVPAAEARDPWTGIPIVSLYGEHEGTLRPSPGAFDDLDLLLVDLQDVGARYYTYAATGIWAAEAALKAGVEVWFLDRPNPLGGVAVEGPRVSPGFDSFVGAFDLPVRHGLTLGELVALEAARRDWPEGWRVVAMAGWERSMLWPDTGLQWIAPSPNLPTPAAAMIYPGTCLVEGTVLSEGRGTTRPFELIGAPGVPGPEVSSRLTALGLPGVAFLPMMFKPQSQKHAGRACSGIRILLTDPRSVRPLRTGAEILRAFAELAPEAFGWRREAYEFVTDRPAIDLLAGNERLRSGLESDPPSLEDWLESQPEDERRFREERKAVLLYD